MHGDRMAVGDRNMNGLSNINEANDEEEDDNISSRKKEVDEAAPGISVNVAFKNSIEECGGQPYLIQLKR